MYVPHIMPLQHSLYATWQQLTRKCITMMTICAFCGFVQFGWHGALPTRALDRTNAPVFFSERAALRKFCVPPRPGECSVYCCPTCLSAAESNACPRGQTDTWVKLLLRLTLCIYSCCQ
jgi:hypothetical protein